MRIVLDTDKKTITVPWNYAAKLEEINRIIKDAGVDKQYTVKTYLEESWKNCLDDTDKCLKVAAKPIRIRKWVALLLAAVLCLSLGIGIALLSASGDTPANIVVDGEEISAKDFLIEHLNAYIQSDAYLARTAAFEKASGREAPPFAVTYAFELKVDGWCSENQPLHFFMVKANCANLVGDIIYDSVTMAIDYDTGTVYDRYSVDESWMEKSEKEQAIYTAVEGGCFVDAYYNGEPIFVDSEIHIPLSDSDIAEVNQALSK